LTRNRVLTITLILLLVAFLGYLTIDNQLLNRSQKSLSSQIQVDKQVLAVLPPPDDSLTQLLVKARAENQMAEASVTYSSASSTEVIASLLKIAEQHSIVVSPFNTEPWTLISLNSANYKILPMVLEIQGSLPNLISYLNNLENKNSYPYLIIRGLTISDSITSANNNNSGTSISAELKIAVIQRLESHSQGEP
jgi:hypothetical protein